MYVWPIKSACIGSRDGSGDPLGTGIGGAALVVRGQNRRRLRSRKFQAKPGPRSPDRISTNNQLIPRRTYMGIGGHFYDHANKRYIAVALLEMSEIRALWAVQKRRFEPRADGQ